MDYINFLGAVCGAGLIVLALAIFWSIAAGKENFGKVIGKEHFQDPENPENEIFYLVVRNGFIFLVEADWCEWNFYEVGDNWSRYADILQEN